MTVNQEMRILNQGPMRHYGNRGYIENQPICRFFNTFLKAIPFGYLKNEREMSKNDRKNVNDRSQNLVTTFFQK